MMFKGAKYTSQKCQPDKCPQLFTWCRTRSAEMPTCWRTIWGELISGHRNVNGRTLSPTNHRGPLPACRNAIIPTPPPVLFGAKQTVQKCRREIAPRKGSSKCRRNANLATPFPANHRGPKRPRRNANPMSPPPNLGHTAHAEMPDDDRPNNTDQRPVEER